MTAKRQSNGIGNGQPSTRWGQQRWALGGSTAGHGEHTDTMEGSALQWWEARCEGGGAAYVPVTQRQREVPGSCAAGKEGVWCWWLAPHPAQYRLAWQGAGRRGALHNKEYGSRALVWAPVAGAVADGERAAVLFRGAAAGAQHNTHSFKGASDLVPYFLCRALHSARAPAVSCMCMRSLGTCFTAVHLRVQDVTLEELQQPGCHVSLSAQPHTVLGDTFFVSGEVPRVTPYETGQPGHATQQVGGWLFTARCERYSLCHR